MVDLLPPSGGGVAKKIQPIYLEEGGTKELLARFIAGTNVEPSFGSSGVDPSLDFLPVHTGVEAEKLLVADPPNRQLSP